MARLCGGWIAVRLTYVARKPLKPGWRERDRRSFDTENGHALAARLHRIHVAKMNEESSVEVWGTGDPKREFLHVDDFACACVYRLENYSAALPIHVGTGTEISMRELAELIGEVVRFDRPFHFNTSKPNGNTAEVP